MHQIFSDEPDQVLNSNLKTPTKYTIYNNRPKFAYPNNTAKTY